LRRTVVALATATGLLLAACSNDDGEAAPDSVEPPASDAPAPTDPTTVATDPPTTTAATTTSDAPTTTVDPAAALADLIKQTRLAAEEARSAALADPSNADLRTAIANFRTGGALARAIATLDDLVANGQVVRRNPANPTTITFEGKLQLPAGPDGAEAHLIECRVDSDVLYEVGTGPNGTDVLINDTVIAERLRTRYVLEGGTWKIEGGEQLGSWTGASTCPV
jgi:hypothetical protein